VKKILLYVGGSPKRQHNEFPWVSTCIMIWLQSELVDGHNVYMRQHPELKALLADLVQFLLLRKPHDVVEFAADYFSSFATKMPGTSGLHTHHHLMISLFKITYLN